MRGVQLFGLQPGLWPGLPQDGLGQEGLRLKWAKGQFYSKNEVRRKVLRMDLPIVESLSGLQENTSHVFWQGPSAAMSCSAGARWRPHY